MTVRLGDQAMIVPVPSAVTGYCTVQFEAFYERGTRVAHVELEHYLVGDEIYEYSEGDPDQPPCPCQDELLDWAEQTALALLRDGADEGVVRIEGRISVDPQLEEQPVPVVVEMTASAYTCGEVRCCFDRQGAPVGC